MADANFEKLDTETKEQYIDRVCSMKEICELKWGDVTRILNEGLGTNYDESVFRKGYAARLKKKNEPEDDTEKVNTLVKKAEEEGLTEEDKLVLARLELKKEKVKISDERIQTNAYVRQLAREDTIKEIAIQCAKEMNGKKLLGNIESIKVEPNDNRAILLLSDWHLGININNYWNVYNPDVAKKRIAKLTAETIYKCEKYNVKELHIANLGDLICGRIHLGLRLESRYDVITQTMQASEMLAEMILELSKHFKIHYYDCLDNHSRLEPNKKDAMDLESLARIIPWYLKERLDKEVEVHNNEISEDIVAFKCGKYSVIGCHGDKDKINTVVDNMTLMTHKHYDMVITAHLHHFQADENHETVVVSNGSLMGTDTYAKNLRLCSKPSQTLIIATNKSVCEDICRIVLD